MFLRNYDKIIKDISINQSNVYNLNNNLSLKDLTVKVDASFNTFKDEKNLKFTRLYALIIYLTNQRPVLRKVNFSFLKKKILKKFVLSASLSKNNKANFLLYLFKQYIYYFQIYYQKPVKYNLPRNRFTIYLDNPQFFIKNYNKHGQKIQLKISFAGRKGLEYITKYISNFFILRLTEKNR